MGAVDDNIALIGRFLTHNQFQERTLSGAGRAYDKYKLPVCNGQIHILQCMCPVAICLAHIFKFNHFLSPKALRCIKTAPRAQIPLGP